MVLPASSRAATKLIDGRAEIARLDSYGQAPQLSGIPQPDHGWSDARRWFAHYRVEPLTALLNAAGFSVVAARRWGLHRDWLGVRARREAEVPNVTN